VLRGYSEWSSDNYRWASSTRDGYPNFKLGLYDDVDSKDKRILIDDIVWSTEKVPSSYGVGGTNPSFEPFDDGWESGDFSMWNDTDYYAGGVAPSVTSAEQYSGVYSANFTVDGASGSTSRADLLVQNRTDVFMKSEVWYSELPDTNNTRVMCIRADTPDGTYIASAGIYRIDANYYWCIRHTSGGVPPQNYTLATINPQTWYTIEFYVNVTVNGNFTLWVEDVLICQTLGDYSSLSPFGMVLAYANVYGAQSDEKTVLHDDFRTNDEYMGSGFIIPFKGSLHFLTGVEDEPEVFDPLQYITINGTGVTDESGYYEWINLTYNTEYLFVIGNVTGYYPAWCLNVEGSYYWNGSNYLLYHTITEDQTGYIQPVFFSTSQPYINYTTAKTISTSLTSTVLSVACEGSTTTTEIYTGYGSNRFLFVTDLSYDFGGNDAYDSVTEMLTIVDSSASFSYEVVFGTFPYSTYVYGVTSGYITSGTTDSTLLRFSGSIQGTDSTATVYFYTDKRPRYVKAGGVYVDFTYDSATNVLSFDVASSPPKHSEIIFGFNDEEIVAGGIFGVLNGFGVVIRHQLKMVKRKIEEKLGKKLTWVVVGLLISLVVVIILYFLYLFITIYLG